MHESLAEAWHIRPNGPLVGEVQVCGSKNAVTKHMVAAMLGAAWLSLRIALVSATVAAVIGLAAAILPVPVLVACFLWLDRYESEPTSMLALAFFWGAAVATFGALVIHTASMQAIDAAGEVVVDVVGLLGGLALDRADHRD